MFARNVIARRLSLVLGIVALGCEGPHGDPDGGGDAGRGATTMMPDAGSDDAGPPAPRCGNAQLEVGERCDDGNTEDGDGCRADCQGLEQCGDGLVDVTEACDDGNLEGGDGCRADCTLESCGDGIVDPGESCDDANTESGDGCRADCTSELCGDSQLDLAEVCDDGNTDDGDGCRGDCAGEEVCGDGLVDVAEACDDGTNDGAYGGCAADCSMRVECGNGVCEASDESCWTCAADCGSCCPAPPAVTRLSCGDSVTGTNVGASHRFGDSAAPYSCGAEALGAEVYYEVEVATPSFVRVVVSTASTTADLELLQLDGACDPASCVHASTSPPGGDEQLAFHARPGEPRFFAVDGYRAADAAEFTISVECETPAPCTPGGWSAETVAEGAGGARIDVPDLAIASDGALHFAYVESYPVYRLRHATRDASGRWASSTVQAQRITSFTEPDLEVGPDGAAHLAYWLSETDEIRYATYAAASRTWSSARVFVGATGWAGLGSASLEIDAAGGRHLAYCTTGDARVRYASRSATASTWSSQIAITPYIGHCQTRLARSSTGHLFISYGEYTLSLGQHTRIAQRSATGSWTNTFLSPIQNSVALAATGSRFHALYLYDDGSYDFQLRYVTGTTAPGTPTTITRDGFASGLVIDGAGTLHAVYVRDLWDSYEVVYGTLPSGGSWTWEVVATTSGELAAALALDASGAPHVTYADGGRLVHAQRCPP